MSSGSRVDIAKFVALLTLQLLSTLAAVLLLTTLARHGRAQEWNCVLPCDDPEDMSPDGSKAWAIDKQNVAKPPLDWESVVRLRGASGKFADVLHFSIWENTGYQSKLGGTRQITHSTSHNVLNYLNFHLLQPNRCIKTMLQGIYLKVTD
ncbi:hypothetical protein EJB05_54318, partial [Eragrostis curvula]